MVKWTNLHKGFTQSKIFWCKLWNNIRVIQICFILSSMKTSRNSGPNAVGGIPEPEVTF